jgi:putative restriction endonuclease
MDSVPGKQASICVGVTDNRWFDFLAHEEGIDEVNFWRPSPRVGLQGLQPGDLFLFRLHAPVAKIAGGGRYLKYLRLPIDYAWMAYGRKNGVESLEALRQRVAWFRREEQGIPHDSKIGCILLSQPFFLDEKDWFSPPNWGRGIQSVKYYQVDSPDGKFLSEMVSSRNTGFLLDEILAARDAGLDPKRVLVNSRPGQSYFSSVVADAYDWRCAVTRERVLPTLDAAHILPVREKGPNIVQNGLLLRTDVHRLFDTGYATITREGDGMRFVASGRVDEEFHNGKQYLAMTGKLLHLPKHRVEWPDQEFVTWHNRLFDTKEGRRGN